MNRILIRRWGRVEIPVTWLVYEGAFPALRLFLVFLQENTLIVRSAGGEQVVDDTGQWVGGGGDDLRSTQPGTYPAVIAARMGAASSPCLGSYGFKCMLQRKRRTGVGALVSIVA